jgi:FkbM family methyltransferase
MSPWIVLDSIHGKFIVNRHCAYVAEWIVKTGATHIEAEIATLVGIANTLPEKCVIVDAGASHGLISVPLANAVKEKGGKVHAFEIQPPFHRALCGTAMLNDLNNLTPWCCGLGDDFTWKDFPEIDYSVPQDFGLVSLMNKIDKAKFMVEIKPLEAIGFERLDLLKIDVEGMEFQVLTGARRSLVEFRPWCWVEYNMSDVDALKSCFDGLDYTFFRFDQQNMLCAPRKRLVESGIKVEAETM